MWTLRREGQVIAPDERLPWPAMFGLGAQHVLAMFGATALVPVLTDFPVSTTLLFAGIGTILFVLITGNRVPSFTGSSFAFIAPVTAAMNDGGMAEALGGIVASGIALAAIGIVIDRAGYRVVEFLLPPVVTGAIVMLIGLNLAPVAKDQFSAQAGIALFTLVVILLGTVALRGLLQKLSVFIGVALGYVFAAILGKVNWDGVRDADWIGFPDFTTPAFSWHAIVLIVPAVLLVLIAENAAHVKSVAVMTERDMDPLIGRSIAADGAATTLAGAFGGSGTTTYAENIGVMGLTRVYSTLAYIIAGGIAIALALLPKFGAIISAIPIGVLGGAVTVLFGLIAILGARIWVDARVDFRDPVNLAVAGVAVIVGAGNYTLTWGDYQFAGIALGTVAAVVIYQVLRPLNAERPSPPTDPAPALDPR
ncbi:nitrate reductase [Solirubrobacter sp. CPCC 204708]|uniref:NCS2 family nucleobase:cation symporter n=1 Tax=Solirubrobacter deserti TaxID=2282478 RepID=A0ABT4RPH7_9ACTN|nr:solute carrier family 23 protein [Solirubrobacter deserti]MBE2319950.1 nitrate reductase [Solirubrobacter deserti]MDA0140456.1 NCS2 family nucleobase:cation symporter [Solirubrobacter deserti]